MRCDSHVHIVGPSDRYPQVATRTYLADVAALDTLRAAGAKRGIGRYVIVQPSFYGTDNSATLEAVDALGGQGRAVAVLDPATLSEEMLAEHDRRGVRGLRINLYSPLGSKAQLGDAFAANAQAAQEHGWHVELIAPIGMLLDTADDLARAPVTIVIDHYGLYGTVRPQSEEGRRLLELLRQRHVWMKLSAPYRVSDNALQTQPDKEWLAAILEAAPERCVWGSDWPFTPAHDQHQGGDRIAPYRPLAYETLVDDFLSAVAEPALAERILVDNPGRLYGF
jgi:predicted TIM-barrel fold metal-dependent hydrolase